DVNGHHAIEVALGGLVRVDDIALDTGVVVRAIQAAMILHDSRDQRLHLGVVANVSLRKFGFASGLANFGGGRFAAFLAHVGAHDGRAFARKSERGYAADSASTTGYERDFSFKQISHWFDASRTLDDEWPRRRGPPSC